MYNNLYINTQLNTPSSESVSTTSSSLETPLMLSPFLDLFTPKYSNSETKTLSTPSSADDIQHKEKRSALYQLFSPHSQSSSASSTPLSTSSRNPSTKISFKQRTPSYSIGSGNIQSAISSILAMSLINNTDTNADNLIKGPTGPAGPLINTSVMEYKSLIEQPTIVWTMTNPIINNGRIILTGNRNLSMIGLVNGITGTLIVVQDNIGNRKLTLPPNSKVISNGNGKVFLSVQGNSIDMLSFTYDGIYIYWSCGNSFT